MRRKEIKAMSVIEYSIIWVTIVAVFIGIGIYLKRAICGNWRETADTFGFGRVYDSPTPIMWDN